MLFVNIFNAENEFPELKGTSKKLARVGAQRITKSQFKPFPHKSRLLSLDNAVTREKVLQFCTKVITAAYVKDAQSAAGKSEIPLRVMIEPKIDGLSISLHYMNGEILFVLTALVFDTSINHTIEGNFIFF